MVPLSLRLNKNRARVDVQFAYFYYEGEVIEGGNAARPPVLSVSRGSITKSQIFHALIRDLKMFFHIPRSAIVDQ
jgi:hypothetical protein